MRVERARAMRIAHASESVTHMVLSFVNIIFWHTRFSFTKNISHVFYPLVSRSAMYKSPKNQEPSLNCMKWSRTIPLLERDASIQWLTNSTNLKALRILPIRLYLSNLHCGDMRQRTASILRAQRRAWKIRSIFLILEDEILSTWYDLFKMYSWSGVFPFERVRTHSFVLSVRIKIDLFSWLYFEISHPLNNSVHLFSHIYVLVGGLFLFLAFATLCYIMLCCAGARRWWWRRLCSEATVFCIVRNFADEFWEYLICLWHMLNKQNCGTLIMVMLALRVCIS
jgi:hypothetical protein